VHGVIWPQVASEWTTLSKQERLDGAEAMVAAGKGGKTAITIGVQGPDIATVLEYVKHAEKIGAERPLFAAAGRRDRRQRPVRLLQADRHHLRLPLFVQSQPFPMSMDLIVRMYKEIPSFRQIKDEAGDTLARITEIRTRTNDAVKVFTGNGVRNMVTELMLGAQGFCPTVDLADIYAQAFDLWYAGKHSEAFDMFGRVLCFGTISETVGAPGKYVWWRAGLQEHTLAPRGHGHRASGRERHGSRRGSGARWSSASGGAGWRWRTPRPSKPFDAEGEKTIRAALELLKPYMKA